MKSTLMAILLLSISVVSCERKVANTNGQPSDGIATIQREIVTPSGDWYGLIDYTYGPNGILRHVSYEFRTFAGYDSNTDEVSSTMCVREYDATETGELILRSKATTDLSTGEPVVRGFYEPEVIHWMTLTEARKNQAEPQR